MNRYLLLIGLVLLSLSIITLPAGKLLYLHGPAWMSGIEAEMTFSIVITFATLFIAGLVCSIYSLVRESQ